MHEFAKETMRDRAQARAFSNTHASKPVKIEDTRSSMPMSSNLTSQKAGRKTRRPAERTVHHKPFPFALEYDSSGARIYYGELLVAINQTALSGTQETTGVYHFSLVIEQQEIPNPTAYVPVNLDTDDLSKPTKLGWFGDVFLQWECDENAVMDPDSVEIVGPDTPSSIPIPAFSSTSPPPMTTCRYFVKIGTVPEDGRVIQNHASDVFWQISLIRGGGTGI